MALTPSQKTAFDAVMRGESVFITGGGGVGKTYLIDTIQERLQSKGKKVLLCASTGRAAHLIGGVTAHSAFRIPLKMAWNAVPKVDKKSAVYNADVVIIDEVSMLRMDAFEYIIKILEVSNEVRAKEGKRPIQLVVVGDFLQLPPVIVRKHDGPDDADLMKEYYGFDVGNAYAFQAPGWKRYGLTTYELTEVMRQSGEATVNALNAIRRGDRAGLAYIKDHSRKKPFPATERGVIRLCGKNRTAESINATETGRLPGLYNIYKAEEVGEVSEQDKIAPEVLRLKTGAQVIMLINSPADGYTNGSAGIITAMTETAVVVRFESGQESTVRPYTWNIFAYATKEEKDKEGNKQKKVEQVLVGSYTQLPMRLGYAITIHKSQGQTYNKVSLKPEIFATGQLSCMSAFHGFVI